MLKEFLDLFSKIILSVTMGLIILSWDWFLFQCNAIILAKISCECYLYQKNFNINITYMRLLHTHTQDAPQPRCAKQSKQSFLEVALVLRQLNPIHKKGTIKFVFFETFLETFFFGINMSNHFTIFSFTTRCMLAIRRTWLSWGSPPACLVMLIRHERINTTLNALLMVLHSLCFHIFVFFLLKGESKNIKKEQYVQKL